MQIYAPPTDTVHAPAAWKWHVVAQQPFVVLDDFVAWLITGGVGPALVGVPVNLAGNAGSHRGSAFVAAASPN